MMTWFTWKSKKQSDILADIRSLRLDIKKIRREIHMTRANAERVIKLHQEGKIG